MESKLLNRKKVKFGIFEAALASLLFVIYNFLFVQIYLAICPNGVTENTFAAFAVQFLLEAMFGVTAVTVALSKKVDFKATGIKKRFNAKIVLLGLGISLVSLYGFGNVTNVFLDILYLLGYRSVLGNISITTFWQYLGYVIASCVAPAIFEELLFRGTILSGLKELGIKLAVILSSLIFTFMHGNPEQTVHQFIIGVIVGYLFFKSNNLWLGIIVHFFNNFISVTQAYVLSWFMDTAAVASETVTITFTSLVVDIVIAGILVYVGYEIVKWLIQKMLIEDAKLNGVVEEMKEEQTILVDGQEVVAEVVVEGTNVASSDVETASGNNPLNEKQPISASTVVCFALSACYMLYEWVAYLLMGLGVI